ncbi:hypothetical protein AMTRI_Chr04g242640 [Amborella trichopoda]|uniref:pentatricopeptide repeat-containing protein At1g77360, mitochondrial n=1 Tax=Amborella trichopoda TaxID=13333 RepID=UPI0005D36A89|nr:pentatricopeptide repeat-containing protein At1g77360, mitochondrial [Amborella trichopoda]|eukprot:XP_011625376.1 pentatricopeptide repeat-containing protein At1g77360, mitochondrial [Amborella trichopoda]
MASKKRMHEALYEEPSRLDNQRYPLSNSSPLSFFQRASPSSTLDPSQKEGAPIPQDLLLSGSSTQSLIPPKKPTFVSYTEVSGLSPKIKVLCELLAETPSSKIEQAFWETGIRVSQEDVEEVLKLNYGSPSPAVKFFRWASTQLGKSHSPHAWNLLVDLLGKNWLFDAMWDALKSMRKDGLLSFATFASVFSSYVSADKINEAIMTFEVMDQYGCHQGVVALNSLLSAICIGKQTSKACEFFDKVKAKITPDSDTYAILLEGWEAEGNVGRARETFGEMVLRIGWEPMNVPANDSFLNTLLKGSGVDEALKFFKLMRENRCFPGMKFFRGAFDMLSKQNRTEEACDLWEVILGNGFTPDTLMYNSMIGLLCYINRIEKASQFMDEMVFNGAFPDLQTYNLIFQYLVRSRKLKEASSVFNEMVKNEGELTHTNCLLAIRVYLDSGDSNTAINIWKHMLEKGITSKEECGNLLVVGLRGNNRLSEARKYAEDMIDRGIVVHSSTLSKLKHGLIKVGKEDFYDRLARKLHY